MQIFDQLFYSKGVYCQKPAWLTIWPAWIIFVTFALLMGCAVSPNDVVEEWKAKGWKVEKIHGTQGPVHRHGKLISKQAQAIEASWMENGRRRTKLYPQVNYQYLVLRFFKKDKDEFVVVMKKRK